MLRTRRTDHAIALRGLFHRLTTGIRTLLMSCVLGSTGIFRALLLIIRRRRLDRCLWSRRGGRLHALSAFAVLLRNRVHSILYRLLFFLLSLLLFLAVFLSLLFTTI